MMKLGRRKSLEQMRTRFFFVRNEWKLWVCAFIREKSSTS